MLKSDEIAKPDSCWNKAREDENVFVLLERDIVCPATIRYWCAMRLSAGKNNPGDAQITEALNLAHRIEQAHPQ